MKKWGVRFIGIILALGLILSTFLVYGSENESKKTVFWDLPEGHWAAGDIGVMQELGIIEGYPDGSFKPRGELTYGEFIKMVCALAEAMGDKAVPDGEFSDKKGHWAERYYDWALFSGYFRENQIEKGMLPLKIPRGHMALIASSIMGERAIENYDRLEGQFSDVEPRTENSFEIVKAAGEGILKGYPDGTFRPEGTLSRSEGAAALFRLYEKLTETRERQGEVLINELNLTSGKRVYTYEVIEARLGDKGIVEFENVNENTVKVISTEKHPYIRILLSDGTMMRAVGFPDGFSYFERDGFYIYMGNPRGRDVTGEIPYLLMDDSDKVYKYTDVRL